MLLLLPQNAFCDQIYSYLDTNGVTHFSDVPNSQSKALSKIDTKSVRTVLKAKPNSDYKTMVKSSANKYQIDESLIHAIIRAESGYNEKAVSSKGALGLMQLMPDTALDMGVYNPLEPQQNIEGGTRYLKYLLDKFDGDLNLAVAAYNAGPATVEKYQSIPPYSETQQYTKKVLKYYGKSKDSTFSAKYGETIYIVRLEDGTFLYTNSRFLQKNPPK